MRSNPMNKNIAYGLVATALGVGATAQVHASPEEDRRAVAALDTEFQAAVKRNDADAMGRILHEEMILVLGDGKTHTRKEILESAREQAIKYEVQDEDP